MADNRTVILTVIADASDRAAVARALRGEGFEVREATTGKEALALAAGNPALIVLDINLPDMSGYEVGRRLKGDPATADTAVVYLSAEHGRHGGPEAGADGYLTRPVEPNELVATVRSLLRMRRAEAEVHRQTARVAALEREVAVLEALAGQPPAAVTANLLGAAPLREANPEAFARLADDFAALLDLALQQRQFRVAHPLTERLREMSERLGFLRAGPRDVVAVYSSALQARAGGTPAARAGAYVDEGRLLALELMGHLVSYYRLRATGGRP